MSKSPIILENPMASESMQHKLDRVRRPRVQITYDVETNGQMEKIELPFVVGVMADLSAQRKEPLPIVKDRKFAAIDRDNFNDVLSKAAPRLALKVDDKLTGKDQKIGVELNFNNLDDFEPARVAEQIPALNELLQMRQRLSELLGRTQNSDKLDQLLGEVLTSSDKALALAKEMGIDATAPTTEESK